MSLDEKILAKIEKENIWIRPRWFFTIQNLFFGGLFALMLVGGAISFGIILDIASFENNNKNLSSLPFFWMVVFVMFLLVGRMIVNRLGWIYKVRILSLVVILLAVNALFGYFVFASGKAEKIEQQLIEKLPLYQKISPISKWEEKNETNLNRIVEHDLVNIENEKNVAGEHNYKEADESDDRDSETHNDNSSLGQNRQNDTDIDALIKKEKEEKEEKNQVLLVEKKIPTVDETEDEDVEVVSEKKSKEISSQENTNDEYSDVEIDLAEDLNEEATGDEINEE
ncbi:MAG: hypothetical protein Q7T51_00585 [Candidatus Moranbacteria bacterium]|nr:hypothetical protein [Candidatus Moranbacteria bacterium]